MSESDPMEAPQTGRIVPMPYEPFEYNWQDVVYNIKWKQLGPFLYFPIFATLGGYYFGRPMRIASASLSAATSITAVMAMGYNITLNKMRVKHKAIQLAVYGFGNKRSEDVFQPTFDPTKYAEEYYQRIKRAEAANEPKQ